MLQNRYILSMLLLVALLLMTTIAAEAAIPPKTASQITNRQEQSPAPTYIKVKRLQQLLANTGFYPGQMSGIIDSTTKDAIVRAQKTFKLEQTGNYDEKLVDLLTQEAAIKPAHYRQKLIMEATAYTSQDPGCGSLTKREHRLRKGLVAVDPKYIPLGTRLYVEGYGYAVADDIGRAIKGARIDLAYENRKDAFIFGRHKITVLVLD